MPTTGVSEVEAQVPVTSKKHTERAKKKSKTLAFTTKVNGMNGLTEDAPVSDEDKQDVIDSESQYALLMDEIGGDALADTACATCTKNVFDYREPKDNRKDMATLNTEKWAK